MTLQVNEVTKIRRKVLTETARLQWNGRLLKDVDQLPEQLTAEHEHRYRCCEFKEKAIYAERIKLAMGLSLTPEHAKKRLSTLARHSLAHSHEKNRSQVEVIDIACDGCPIDKYFITNACRNCLGHNCQQACRRGAISIVGNQAYIDQSRCVECGLCRKACKYGAILEVHRPCEAACPVNAITADQERKAYIDQEKCTDCGNCMVSCPFGAISDHSQLLKIIDWLKGDEKTIAMVAPAVIGQMGQKEKLGPLFQALKQLGFDRTEEVSFGADLVALGESEEFVRRVPEGDPYLLSSCCPAFVKLVKTHRPDQANHISTMVSPMAALAKVLKKEMPDSKVVFIGPCVAKKREAMESKVVDGVLTFEELAALFVAADINLATMEAVPEEASKASKDGQGFAAAGGVRDAMIKGLQRFEPVDFRGGSAQGLDECLAQLKLLEKSESPFNFLEGMACSGGCLGGPGVLVDTRQTKRFLDLRGSQLECQASGENQEALEKVKEFGHHLHKQSKK